MFGSSQPQQPKQFGTLFGSSTAPTGGLFASSQPQQTGGGLFGQSNAGQQQGGGLFGSTQTPQSQQGGGLFGSTQASQPQQGGSLFGTTQPSQPQQGGGLFGSTQASQPQQSGGLFSTTQSGSSIMGGFGSSQQNTGGSLFGKPPPTFGASQQQQQQQQPSIFGGSLQPAPTLPSVLQQSQQQQQQLPQLRQSTLFKPFESQAGPREKPIAEQIKLLYDKWDPENPSSAFQQYCYNQVQIDLVPFYGPNPGEDPAKWEEALGKKPSEESVPVLIKGFKEILARIRLQSQAVAALQKRLHEINDSLTVMMQTHDLVIAVRAAEARRKHIAFTQRTLTLATKVQILRNRGYAMDSAEEELKKKLVELEKKAFDPILVGRTEEIWARMSAVRARAHMLQEESEKMGKSLEKNGDNALSEDDQKQVKKLLDDYDLQLSYMRKEIAELAKDYAEWENASTPVVNGNTSGR